MFVSVYLAFRMSIQMFRSDYRKLLQSKFFLVIFNFCHLCIVTVFYTVMCRISTNTILGYIADLSKHTLYVFVSFNAGKFKLNYVVFYKTFFEQYFRINCFKLYYLQEYILWVHRVDYESFGASLLEIRSVRWLDFLYNFSCGQCICLSVYLY